MAPSMTKMSKEEKAAEMARRKEEWKQAHLSKIIPDLWLFPYMFIMQWIAQLKEQKVQKVQKNNKVTGASALSNDGQQGTDCTSNTWLV